MKVTIGSLIAFITSDKWIPYHHNDDHLLD